jgi:hypothetical protein
MTYIYGAGNTGPGLRQTQQCDGVIPVYGIPTLPLRHIDSNTGKSARQGNL